MLEAPVGAVTVTLGAVITGATVSASSMPAATAAS